MTRGKATKTTVAQLLGPWAAGPAKKKSAGGGGGDGAGGDDDDEGHEDDEEERLLVNSFVVELEYEVPAEQFRRAGARAACRAGEGERWR